MIPFETDGNLQILAGKVNGLLVLYDPLLKSEPYTFPSPATTPGRLSQILTVFNIRSGVLCTDYITTHSTTGSIFAYETQSNKLIKARTLNALPLELIKLAIYLVEGKTIYAMAGASSTGSTTPLIILTPTASLSLNIPSIQATSLLIAQSPIFQDQLIIGCKNGDIYSWDIYSYAFGKTNPPPPLILLTKSMGPFTNSPVLPIVATPIRVSQGGAQDYTIISLRDNGMVQMYSFNTQTWTTIGDQSDWKRGSSLGIYRDLKIQKLSLYASAYLMVNWLGS